MPTSKLAQFNDLPRGSIVDSHGNRHEYHRDPYNMTIATMRGDTQVTEYSLLGQETRIVEVEIERFTRTNRESGEVCVDTFTITINGNQHTLWINEANWKKLEAMRTFPRITLDDTQMCLQDGDVKVVASID